MWIPKPGIFMGIVPGAAARSMLSANKGKAVRITLWKSMITSATQEQLTQRKEEAAALEEISRQEKAVAEKETELKDKTKAVAAREQNPKEQENALEELKRKVLEAARKEEAPSELEQLRRKCEALEKYRSSFPYTIAEGYVLYGVVRTELKVSA